MRKCSIWDRQRARDTILFDTVNSLLASNISFPASTWRPADQLLDLPRQYEGSRLSGIRTPCLGRNTHFYRMHHMRRPEEPGDHVSFARRGGARKWAYRALVHGQKATKEASRWPARVVLILKSLSAMRSAAFTANYGLRWQWSTHCSTKLCFMAESAVPQASLIIACL